MSIELEKMRVVIEGDSKSFADESKKAKTEAKSLADAVKKEMNQVKKATSNSASDSGMKEFQNMKNMLKSMAKDMKSLTFFGRISDGVKSYVKQAQIAAGIKVETDEYKQNAEDIERTERVLKRLQEKQRDMDATGIKKSSEEYKKLTQEIEKAKKAQESYSANRLRMQGLGKDVRYNTGSAIGNVGGSAVATAKRMKESIGNAFGNIPVVSKTARMVSKTLGGLFSTFKKITPAIRKTSGTFGALIQKFKTGIPLLGKSKKSMDGMSNASRGLGGALRTLGTTAKYMFASFVIYGALNGMKEGFKNLAQYSDSTNNSISMLMSSLTQLKNSLAAAFAPILDVVAPILNTFIQKIISVANAVGQLMAALTGKGTFVKAKKVQQNYAESLKDTAQTAKKAGEEAKRSVLGFDQLNKLDDNSKENSGKLDGGISPREMFETVEVDSKFKSIAERIKEAWKTADFTEIGSIVGEKLNAALNSIPWGKIRETASKIAKSIATFLNGFISTTDWELVGSTFANRINTVIDFAYEFVTTFEWKKFGRAISDFLNGSIREIEWTKAAEGLSDGVKGILDAIIEFFENADWAELGRKIADFIGTIDWSGITQRVFEGIGAALGGLAAFLYGLIEDAWTSVVDWWKETAYEDGQFTIEGLLKGIWDAMASIGTWIKENIFDPFVNGFKKAFGIHSPSKVMQEQGNYIVQGLLQGLEDKIVDVFKWCAELPQKIKDAIGSLWDIGKDTIKSFIDGFLSIDIPTPHFKKTGNVEIAGISTPIPKIGVEWYEKGGFPSTGEMFVARESGPELVGRMGNRNVVANNNQIVSGIAAGVQSAVAGAFTDVVMAFGGDTSSSPTVEVTIVCDSETLYQTVKKGKEKTDRRYSVVIPV